ncbi:CPBP family intramembrane glutamic endopeptidase [Corynebacterium sp. SA-MJD20WY100]|uniref:CPBP family intramembrane glutamic endopeptidase n=1 Tax=Corynebacterium sp. SA-MJD20WY100 TaxID=3142969 RepID=UPI0032217E96
MLNVSDPNLKHDAGSDLDPSPQLVHVVWSLAALVALLSGAAVGALGLGFIAKKIGASVADFAAVGGVLLGTVAGAAVLYFGLMRSCGWGLRELGFVRPAHSLWHLLWWTPVTMLCGGVGAMLIGTAAGLAPQDGSADRDGFHLGVAAGLLMILCGAVVIPAIEEIVFRRMLFDGLRTKLSTPLAAILVTVAFALVHAQPAVMLYIAFLGTSLVLARLWFQSLWGSFLVHAANNALLSAMILASL